jgi:hypothetical protein
MISGICTDGFMGTGKSAVGLILAAQTGTGILSSWMPSSNSRPDEHPGDIPHGRRDNFR